MDSKERDINVRKALAWQSLNKMNNIWKSNLAKKLKWSLSYFMAVQRGHLRGLRRRNWMGRQARRSKNESGGAEPYIPYIYSIYSSNDRRKKSLFSKKVEGLKPPPPAGAWTYTRMLRKVYNVTSRTSLVTLREKISNKELYGKTEKLSSVIRRNRLKLAGHVYRDKASPVQQLVTWIPKHGTTLRGRPTQSYVDTLLRDTGLKDTNEHIYDVRMEGGGSKKKRLKRRWMRMLSEGGGWGCLSCSGHPQK